MKIFVLTDIHGRTEYPGDVITEMMKADIVVIAGDITNFGGSKEATRIINGISTFNDSIIAVPGNCDRPGVGDVLSAHGMNLHGKARTSDKVQFLGIGGSNRTPFRTPNEYSEDEMKRILGDLPETSNTSFRILISHAPPFNTRMDRMFIGVHVGSKSIREYVEKIRPDIVVCGHIHEARGVDQLGKTLIINPGPFPKHYALVEIDSAVNYQMR
jgi:putative phosphoesterase